MIRNTVVGLGAVALTVPAWAGNSSDHYYDYAQVEHVKPITEYVQVSQPREVCWTEQVSRRSRRGAGSGTPEIVGGIIGGLVGNQIGSGRGKTIATVAGAILGGSVAHDYKLRHGRRYQTYTEPVRRCETRHEYHDEEHVVGYRVRYHYNGNLYTTRMNHHPGETVKVRVHVTVVE